MCWGVNITRFYGCNVNKRVDTCVRRARWTFTCLISTKVRKAQIVVMFTYDSPRCAPRLKRIVKERGIFMALALFLTHNFRNCSEMGDVETIIHLRGMLAKDNVILCAKRMKFLVCHNPHVKFNEFCRTCPAKFGPPLVFWMIKQISGLWQKWGILRHSQTFPNWSVDRARFYAREARQIFFMFSQKIMLYFEP